MKEYMPILYALKTGRLKQEDFVAYKPNKSRYMYIERGVWFGSEKKEAECDLGWHAIIYKGFGVLLVASQMTSATITTTGNCPSYEVLKEYAGLYENNKLETYTVVLTPNITKEIPEHLRIGNVWCYQPGAKPSVFRRTPKRRRDPSRPHDHSYYSGPTYYSKHMQPVLFIPSDTIIEIEDGHGVDQENAFRLYPRNSRTISIPQKDLDKFKDPMWVSLVDAMMTRKIVPTDFVEYVSDKSNELIIQEINKSEDEKVDGWSPILSEEKGTFSVQIVSGSFERLEEDVWDDIIDGKIKCSEFESDIPRKNNIKLLSIHGKLCYGKVRMLVYLPNDVLVQINNPQCDGKTPKKALKLRVAEDK